MSSGMVAGSRSGFPLSSSTHSAHRHFARNSTKSSFRGPTFISRPSRSTSSSGKPEPALSISSTSAATPWASSRNAPACWLSGCWIMYGVPESPVSAISSTIGRDTVFWMPHMSASLCR
eukprot:scaffold7601_cov267-Pinguiococcus_pyrenoidosus.AAC.10